MGSITVARADGLTIGKLSQLTGVNIETIRYYEKINVLPVPPRTESGRRSYGPMERRILAFVRRSRELGFSLDEVRALLRLGGPEKASCREVREIAAQHLDDIRAASASVWQPASDPPERRRRPKRGAVHHRSLRGKTAKVSVTRLIVRFSGIADLSSKPIPIHRRRSSEIPSPEADEVRQGRQVPSRAACERPPEKIYSLVGSKFARPVIGTETRTAEC